MESPKKNACKSDLWLYIYIIEKKLQFITLLTAIMLCFTHRKQHILLRAPCQNVNVLLSNITFIIFAVFDV